MVSSFRFRVLLLGGGRDIFCRRVWFFVFRFSVFLSVVSFFLTVFYSCLSIWAIIRLRGCVLLTSL